MYPLKMLWKNKWKYWKIVLISAEKQSSKRWNSMFGRSSQNVTEEYMNNFSYIGLRKDI